MAEVVTILNNMGREELTSKLTCNQRHKGGEAVSQVEIWGRCYREKWHVQSPAM